jgi:hypothetical protein
MKIRVDFRDLSNEYNRSRTIAPVFKERVKVRVKAKSLTVVGRVKIAMPVDKGLARARWGTPGAPGGIWIEQDAGLTIIQGAELQPFEYINELNEGSSQQAPAGFIDTIAYKAEMELIDEILSDIANGF